LNLWFEILTEAGIDLDLYGELETRSLRSGAHEVILHFDGRNGPYWNPKRLGSSKLIGIEYGTKPQDWKLWWTEPTDVLVGEFWHRIEQETPLLPGSWVDGEDDDDDDDDDEDDDWYYDDDGDDWPESRTTGFRCNSAS
jgi:hypothetical protein